MRSPSRRQAGFSLIEALVSILIFSIGILALVGMQVTAVRQSANAKYRSEASLLANQLIGQMWVTDRLASTLQTNFTGSSTNTGNAGYTAWAATVQNTLPNSSGDNAPTVAVAGDGTVTVNLFWKAPNEQPSDPVHQYTAIARIQ
jgi:type IV pilus assembly protein PilV